MLARLAFAVIGFVLGAMFGVLLWWLFGLGFQPGVGRHSIQPNPLVWMKYTGAVCAVIGFFLKDRVGDFIGSGVRTAFEIEMGTPSGRDWYVPTWLAVLVLLGVVYAVWHFVR